MQPPLPSQRRGKGEGFSSRFICVNPSPQSSPLQEERRSGRAIEISAVLLAGGKLEPVEIFVSARTDPAWRSREVHFVADDSPSRGPLSGLAAALARMHTKHLLALAIDMPFMTEKYLRFLCSQIEPGRGVLPKIDNRAEPLAAIYPQEAAAEIGAALSGADFSLQTLTNCLVAAGKLQVMPVTSQEGKLFLNLNESADLRSIESHNAL